MSGDEQLELFDVEVRDGLAEPEPELVALAARVPAHVRFGTSSWTFPGWDGIVYRRRYANHKAFVRESLAEYARWPLFRTVGVDRSFYSPVPVEELVAYAQMLPEGFECVTKVWSEITTRRFADHERHGARAGLVNPRFMDAELFVREVLEPTTAGLGEHVGPFVLEIPPSPGPADVERFERDVARFLSEVPRGPRYAFELRDRRLFTRRYLALLAEHGATHVLNYHPRMPSLRVQMDEAGALPGPFVVARLMLPPGHTYEGLVAAYAPFDRLVTPRPEMREEVAELVRRTARDAWPTYILANNKAEGSSPLTVRLLAELVSSEPATRDPAGPNETR